MGITLGSGIAILGGVIVEAGSSIPVRALYSWGVNGSGQLGLGDTDNRSSPVQIGALTTWSELGCGYHQTLAIKTDGTLWAWGSGQFGALGLGNTTSYSSPKQVGSLTTWLETAGGYQSIAISS